MLILSTSDRSERGSPSENATCGSFVKENSCSYTRLVNNVAFFNMKYRTPLRGIKEFGDTLKIQNLEKYPIEGTKLERHFEFAFLVSTIRLWKYWHKIALSASKNNNSRLSSDLENVV